MPCLGSLGAAAAAAAAAPGGVGKRPAAVRAAVNL
jgi:hypothetical protein